MNKINEIVICKDEYQSIEDFENAIKRAIMVLLENNYIATIKYDEKGLGIVVIKYDHADQSLGAPYPYWLTSKEIDKIIWDDEEINL